jgi:hypothetical protein
MLSPLYDVMTQLVERQGHRNCIKNGLMLVDVDPFVNHKMLYVILVFDAVSPLACVL